MWSGRPRPLLLTLFLILRCRGRFLRWLEEAGFRQYPRRVRYHNQVPGYHIENFGCRATQADGAALERQFEEHGMSRAANPSKAAVVVMNTCTVTAGADQDAR